MLQSIPQLLSASVKRLAGRSAARVGSLRNALQGKFYFGYWYSHWRA